MGHPPRALHAIAFMLAVLMAWPWNVVLATVGASSGAALMNRGAVLAPVSPRVHRDGRLGKWSQTGGPALAQVFDSSDEEEDGGPLPAASGPSLVPGTPVAFAPTAHHLAPLIRSASRPIARLCRLRC